MTCTAAPSAPEKVEYPCPGCQRVLKVRREFFGSTIVCKHCGNQFVPRAAAIEPRGNQVPQPPANSAVDEARLQALSARVDATQGRLSALDSASAQRDSQLAAAVGDLSRLSADLMNLRLTLATLNDDVSAARQSDPTPGVVAAARQSILDELPHLFREERRAQEERIDALQATLDRLAGQHGELTEQRATSLTQATALEERLAALEQAPKLDERLVALEQAPRLEERLVALEQAPKFDERLAALEAIPRTDPEQVTRLDRLESAWADLTAVAADFRIQADRLREQFEERDRLAAEANPSAEIRAEFDAIRAEHEALRASLTAQDARWAALEAKVARLESAQKTAAQTAEVRWHDFEASALGRSQAFEAELAQHRQAVEDAMTTRWQAWDAQIAERHQSLEASTLARFAAIEAQTNDHQAQVGRLFEQVEVADASRQAKLDEVAAFASRIDTLETDAAAVRRVAEELRDRHETTSRDLEGRLRAFEREVGRLREVKATQSVGPLPAATTGPIVRPAPAIRSAPPAARFDTWPDLDSLIEDLVHERTGAQSASLPSKAALPSTTPRPAPATATATAAPPPSADPATLKALYAAKRDEYYQAMNTSRPADAVAPARYLVDLTRHCTDRPNLDHALWLRNLGICLSVTGEPAEARSRLDAALALCESDAEPAQVPRVMCLFDLVEFCLNSGQSWQALDFCERALNLINAIPNVPDAVQQRADACLDRIQAQNLMGGGAADPQGDPTANIVATA